jgi:Transposase DDE domain group 1
VVTSLPSTQWTAQTVYAQLYCARGDMENRSKEPQLDLLADRTSTAKLWSNQIRLYFSTFAYVLLHALRRRGFLGQRWRMRSVAPSASACSRLGHASPSADDGSGDQWLVGMPMPCCSSRFAPSCAVDRSGLRALAL